MALQKKCTLTDIKDAGKQFDGQMLIGTVKLECWNAGDDIEIVVPVFTVERSEQYKKILGKTVDEQITIWTERLLEQFQPLVDAYISEEALKTNQKVTDAMVTLASSIGG